MILIFFILLINITSQKPLFAAPETGISFSEAARMAVDNSLDLQNEYAAIALREGAWTWGIRAYFPRLNFMASEEDRVSDIGSDSFIKNYSVSVDQLLWDGGRLSLSRKMERADLDFAGSRLKQMALEIAESAVSSYRNVLQGRSILEIQEKTLESLKEQLRILQRETELGLVRPAVLIDAEITVAIHELDIISRSIDLENAEWMLTEKLGLDRLPALSERIDTERSPVLPHPETVRSIVEFRNPDLAALRFSLVRRQAEARAASRSWIPSLRMTGSFGLSGRQYPLSRHNWSVGLSIEFHSPWLSGNFGASAGLDPPYDRNARLQQALSPVPDPGASFSPKAARLALAHELSSYDLVLKETQILVERMINTCSLLDRKRVLAKEALELEGERFRLAELRLSLGEITRIDLMEVHLDYARRESALVEAAVMVLEAERELERLLDFGPGELSLLREGIR